MLPVAGAAAHPRPCGYWGRDLGQGTRLYLSIGERARHLSLRFEISAAVARISPGARLGLPLWLYLHSMPTDDGPLGEVYVANIALQTSDGRPIAIRSLTVRCGRHASLFTDGAGRYDQRAIYAAGTGLTLPFFDADGERNCVASLLRSGAVTLEFAGAAGEPTIVQARLPVRQMVALAGRLSRIERSRQRAGRCHVIDPIPPT